MRHKLRGRLPEPSVSAAVGKRNGYGQRRQGCIITLLLHSGWLGRTVVQASDKLQRHHLLQRLLDVPPHVRFRGAVELVAHPGRDLLHCAGSATSVQIAAAVRLSVQNWLLSGSRRMISSSSGAASTTAFCWNRALMDCLPVRGSSLSLRPAADPTIAYLARALRAVCCSYGRPDRRCLSTCDGPVDKPRVSLNETDCGVKLLP